MSAGIITIAEAKRHFVAQRSNLEDELERQYKLFGLPQWVREYPFAQSIGRKFRADFAWPQDRLLVEVEGGSWVAGRHTSGAGFQKDCEKYNLACVLGWQVLRVTGVHIKSGMALKWTEQVLMSNKGLPMT